VNNDGNIGIGTSSPEFRLSLDNDGGIIAKGAYNSGSTLSISGSGTRLIWYPKKAAFRVGAANASEWDDANIGLFSIAMGAITKASGRSSTAMGESTTASGYASTAMGWNTTASDHHSTAMGSTTTASKDYSTAMGYMTKASGKASTAMGLITTASGDASTAMGSTTTASSYTSTAMGYKTIAKADASTAMGSTTTASGDCSTAMGYHTIASGIESTAMGHDVTASGHHSTAMGALTTASGDCSTAMGYSATASQSGSFIIADAITTIKRVNATAHHFQAHFANGYHLYTHGTNMVGVHVDANGTSWSSISDSTRKDHFLPTDGEFVMAKFRNLRLGSWHLKETPPDQRHYGPMAQEWFSAFGNDGRGVIGNDTTLASADMDGILCIAVKALEQRTRELRAKTEELDLMKTEMKAMEVRIQRLEAALQAASRTAVNFTSF